MIITIEIYFTHKQKRFVLIIQYLVLGEFKLAISSCSIQIYMHQQIFGKQFHGASMYMKNACLQTNNTSYNTYNYHSLKFIASKHSVRNSVPNLENQHLTMSIAMLKTKWVIKKTLDNKAFGPQKYPFFYFYDIVLESCTKQYTK